jgi:hypothetical protein
MSGVRGSARQFTGHVLVEPSGQLDLADVGLESLVRVQEHARRTGSEVALAGLRPQALLILRLTDRISEFAVHGNVGQAVSRSMQESADAAASRGAPRSAAWDRRYPPSATGRPRKWKE